MERWDIRDEHGNRTGRTFRDGQALGEGEYGLLVHVVICDALGRYLVQRRSLKKRFFPGMWDTTGGGVIAGEESCAAAVREVREEVGLSLAVDELKFADRRVLGKGILDIWYVKKDFRIEDCAIDPIEVERIALMPADEMLRIIGENKNEAYMRVLERIVGELGAP